MQDLKVSVITPLYNSAGFIRQTLDRLVAQTYTNWEAILIDDGSTDDTARVVGPYLEDPRFIYIKQKNAGIAGARNAGIAAASSEWVCLLDHDDLWLPAKLEKQVARAQSRECDIVFSDALIIRNDDRWVYSQGFPEVAAGLRDAEHGATVDIPELLLQLNFMCTSSVMVRKSLFLKHGPLDLRAVPADDYEMWLRCLPDLRVAFVDEPLVEYIIHERNFSADASLMCAKTIYALEKTRRKYVGNPERLAQFDRSLALLYETLFDLLLESGAYFTASSYVLRLMARGLSGWRLLSHALLGKSKVRFVNAAQLRLGRPFGKLR